MARTGSRSVAVRRAIAILGLAWLLSLAVGPGGAVRAQDAIDIVVALSRDTIGLSEEAVLEVTVSGAAQNLPAPSLPTLPMFEVYSQGQSSNVTISNGRVQSSVAYRYLILPQKPGSYPINNISLVYNNRRYVGNPVTLTVISQGTATAPELEQRAQDAQGSTRDYFLEAVVDTKNPYVSQQVTLTLRFFIAVQFYGSPELVEPSTTGFWTELLGNKSPYFQKVNNRTYRVIERKYALFPTQTGELTIGRATISLTVAAQRQRRDPFDIFGMMGTGQEVQVRSQPLTINARSLPDAGRPDDFSGTVGKFTIRATAQKTEAEVNQPVSVTIAISGTGNIKSVAEPVIAESPDFRVYKASSNESSSNLNDRIGGTKTFEEVFIPKRPGRLEIPALAFNYFDPDEKRYKVISTRPISLNVLKTEGYAEVPDLPYAAPGMTVGAEARDIRYIKTDPGDLRPVGRLLIHSPIYLAVNAAPVALLAATVIMRRRREKLAGDVGYARARQASREARRRLVRARKLAAVATAGDFYAEASRALLSFVADKLNISPHGLTTDRLSELLTQHGAAVELVDQTTSFLKKCDFARFAPAAVAQADIEQSLHEAEQIMVRMEEVKF